MLNKIDKQLVGEFTQTMMESHLRYLLLVRDEDGKLIYWVNGYSDGIRSDINEFLNALNAGKLCNG